MSYWISITIKFETLSKREKWMVFCVFFILIYFILNTLLLSPVTTKQKSITNQLATDKLQIQELDQQINLVEHQKIVDPDIVNEQHITQVQLHINQLTMQVNALKTTLVNPEKMPELLRNLLKKNSKVKLISLKTLPIKNLLDKQLDASPLPNPAATKTSNEAPVLHTIPSAIEESTVFKHGVEITLEGHYLDLLDYVNNLEKMPWHVLWSDASLNADHSPICQLTLKVYTLSLDQTWLSI